MLRLACVVLALFLPLLSASNCDRQLVYEALLDGYEVPKGVRSLVGLSQAGHLVLSSGVTYLGKGRKSKSGGIEIFGRPYLVQGRGYIDYLENTQKREKLHDLRRMSLAKFERLALKPFSHRIIMALQKEKGSPTREWILLPARRRGQRETYELYRLVRLVANDRVEVESLHSQNRRVVSFSTLFRWNSWHQRSKLTGKIVEFLKRGGKGVLVYRKDHQNPLEQGFYFRLQNISSHFRTNNSPLFCKDTIQELRQMLYAKVPIFLRVKHPHSGFYIAAVEWGGYTPFFRNRGWLGQARQSASVLITHKTNLFTLRHEQQHLADRDDEAFNQAIDLLATQFNQLSHPEFSEEDFWLTFEFLNEQRAYVAEWNAVCKFGKSGKGVHTATSRYRHEISGVLSSGQFMKDAYASIVGDLKHYVGPTKEVLDRLQRENLLVYGKVVEILSHWSFQPKRGEKLTLKRLLPTHF